MRETTEQSGGTPIVRYELSLSEDEAKQGALKLLPRNNRRLQVNIPAGVSTGSLVKLSNALQLTDGHPGDILIEIKIKTEGSTASQTAPAGVNEITDATFESQVLKSGLPVVVDFWAPWCGPCRLISPVMEKAAGQYWGRFKFCKINVDENPQTASQYQAMSIPLLLFFKNGQEVDRSVGAIPENQLLAKLDTWL
jgi:thioredoxin 1